MKRYSRNMNMLSEQEVEDLGRKKVAVIGCGGLGGYVLEMLARLGVGNITAVDGDVFDETNLNRQLLSVTETLGLNKALIAQDRLYSVNPLVDVNAITQSIDEGNVEEVISGHHVIVDAVDNLETRRLLQGAASNLGIPFVHGSIAGWYGQVTTIFPGDKTLDLIYGRGQNSIEKKLGNPSFTPAMVASIQVSEVLKILIGRGELLRHKMVFIDLLEQEYEVIEF